MRAEFPRENPGKKQWDLPVNHSRKKAEKPGGMRVWTSFFMSAAVIRVLERERGRTEMDRAKDGAQPAAVPKRRRSPVRMKEIEQMWADVMRDETVELRQRMHAAELCAKAINAAADSGKQEEAAAAGRLDEVLNALWGCTAGHWNGEDEADCGQS